MRDPLYSSEVSNCSKFEQSAIPAIDLQTAIDNKVLEMSTAKTQEARRSAWNELQALIKSRPPKEVARMEAELGLTR